MCYLCAWNDPFGIKDSYRDSLEDKKRRAKQIKEMLKSCEAEGYCDKGKEEVDRLKEEQYKLSREM